MNWREPPVRFAVDSSTRNPHAGNGKKQWSCRVGSDHAGFVQIATVQRFVAHGCRARQGRGGDLLGGVETELLQAANEVGRRKRGRPIVSKVDVDARREAVLDAAKTEIDERGDSLGLIGIGAGRAQTFRARASRSPR